MSSDARKQWSKRVERWKDSGLTAKEFAQEMGINANTLSHWGWKLKGEKPTPPTRTRNRKPAARFVEVVATIAPSTAEALAAAPSREVVTAPAPEPLEVLLREGLRIRVPVHFDDVSLRRVVTALEAR